jgi:amino acid adenylation domain-containing protein
MSLRAWHQRFSDHARKRPEAIALSSAGAPLTYAELEARANRLARWLREQGVGSGQVVGLCLDWAPDVLIAMLATLKAGGAYLPLDPALPPARRQAMLNLAAPRALLTSVAWRSGFENSKLPVLCLDAEPGQLAAFSSEAFADTVEPGQLCYVIFTSGSTGEPKGVMVNHGNVAELFAPFAESFAFGPDDVWSWAHSFGFGFSAWEIWGALTHGARLVAVPRTARADPQALRERLRAEGVTVLSQTPSAFRQNLLAPAFADLEGLALRLIALSGEPVSLPDIERWFDRHPARGPRLIDTYAITETGGQVTCREFQWGELASTSARSVGRPLPGLPVLILDDEGRPVPSGEAGELWVGGPGVARGYAGDPELTAQRFVHRDGVRWYRSGDRFRQLGNGELEFLGRADQQLKWRGHRIEPAEIESALREHPSVAAAAVALKTPAEGPARLVAYVVPTAADERPEFWPAVGPYQVYDEFLYDLMSSESRRVEHYRAGLAAVAPGQAVLDIGTGEHALLARLAAEAGARRVYAVEVLPGAAQKARRLVEALGLADRISVITGDIAVLPPPEPVAVATQGIIGNIGSADGIVPLWNAARRWFSPACVPVPTRCRTLIAPAELPSTLARQPAFGPLAREYAERVFAAEGRRFDIRLCVRNFPSAGLLAAPAEFEDLDFRGALAEAHDGAAEFRLTRAGRVDGFLLWTVVDTGAAEPVDYLAHQQGWLPVFFPLPDGGLDLADGASLSVRWTRRVSQGICPDYALVASIAGRELRYVSRHAETALNSTALHRALWNTGEPAPRSGADEFRDWLAQRLPEYMLPQAWITLERLPLTANGKLDRDALPAPSRERPELATARVAPRDPLEQQLAEIWAEVLALDGIGVQDNFFDLGGDSISAVRLASALQRRLDRGIGLATIFASPTIAGLAGALRDGPAWVSAMEQGEL